jgi:hypothetical protein
MSFFFLVPDFPEEASFLTEAERRFVKARLQDDVGSSSRHEILGFRQVLNVFKDCEWNLLPVEATPLNEPIFR